MAAACVRNTGRVTYRELLRVTDLSALAYSHTGQLTELRSVGKACYALVQLTVLRPHKTSKHKRNSAVLSSYAQTG